MMTKAEVKTISNMVSGNRSHLSSREHRHEMQTDAIDRNSIAVLGSDDRMFVKDKGHDTRFSYA